MPRERLELSWVAPHDFESCTSTDSVTAACDIRPLECTKLCTRTKPHLVLQYPYHPFGEYFMAYESNAVFWIEVEKIVPNPYQPRREFDPQKLKELSDSIRMYGVLQPLVVTRREIMREDGAFSTEYELIAGERRLRASKMAGLSQVPVLIRSGEESHLMKLELAIIENLQREDLNAVDRAFAFRQLADAFGFSHTQVAEKVGRSREYVSNSIRLLLLPETILGALRVNDISDGHARTLLMLNDRPEEQDVVFREILMKKLSVREVERIARKIATEKVRKKEWAHSDPELIEIERKFTESLGTRVQIVKTDFGGKVTIDYFSPEDLHKILWIINGTGDAQGGGVAAAVTDDATSESLARLAEATPLIPSEETVEDTAWRPDERPEDRFTRFDSLEHTDIPEPLDVVLGNAEVTHEVVPEDDDHMGGVVDTILTESTVPDVTPASSELEKPQERDDDADLYALKNFSL